MLFTLHAKCKRIKTSVPSVSQVEGASWQVACGRWQQAAASVWQVQQVATGNWQVAGGSHHWRRLPSCWLGSDAAFQSACCQVPSASCLLPPACLCLLHDASSGVKFGTSSDDAKLLTNLGRASALSSGYILPHPLRHKVCACPCMCVCEVRVRVSVCACVCLKY